MREIDRRRRSRAVALGVLLRLRAEEQHDLDRVLRHADRRRAAVALALLQRAARCTAAAADTGTRACRRSPHCGDSSAALVPTPAAGTAGTTFGVGDGRRGCGHDQHDQHDQRDQAPHCMGTRRTPNTSGTITHQSPQQVVSADGARHRGEHNDAYPRPARRPRTPRFSASGAVCRMSWTRSLAVTTLPADTLAALCTKPMWVNACGKLPSWRSADRVVLLGEQADVVGETGEPLEQRARLVEAPLHHVVVGEPERAREEHALAGGQAVGDLGAVGSAARSRRGAARARSRRPCRRCAGRPRAGTRTSAA